MKLKKHKSGNEHEQLSVAQDGKYAHEECDLLLFFRVTLAVGRAEVDVLMMLLFNNHDLSGTQLETVMSRRELVGILGLELSLGLGSSC